MKKWMWCLVLFVSLGVCTSNSQEKDSSRFSVSIDVYPIYIEHSLRRVGDMVQNTFPTNDSMGVMHYRLISRPLSFPQDLQMMFRGTVSFRCFSDQSIGVGMALSTLSMENTLGGALRIGSNGLWWLRLWGVNILPIPDNTDPSWLSPISYSAKESFSLDMFDMFATKTVFTEDANFVFLGGIRLAKPSYRLGVEERQHATPMFNGITADDIILFQGSSVSDFSFCGGPVVGLSIQKSLGMFELRVSASEALLYTEARYYGEVHIKDNLVFLGLSDFSDEIMAFEEKRNFVAGFTEASWEVSFWALPWLRVGAGGFYSLWNIPRGPILSGLWDLRYNKPFLGINPEGLEWHIEEGALSSYGYRMSLNFEW